jgi:hypothetical protein
MPHQCWEGVKEHGVDDLRAWTTRFQGLVFGDVVGGVFVVHRVREADGGQCQATVPVLASSGARLSGPSGRFSW